MTGQKQLQGHGKQYCFGTWKIKFSFLQICLMMSQKNKVSWYNTCENLSSNFKLGRLTKRAQGQDNQNDSVMSPVN